jgi:hypothetical protein
VPIDKPYYRTCRQFKNGDYIGYFVTHAKFAQSPEHYVRAFLLLQKDLQELFDYIEPADANLACYSYRIHALLLRACVEVEANCKAILKENGYQKNGDLNMKDYKKIEKTHLLSGFKIKLPVWQGSQATRSPFSAWQSGGTLPWYEAYNAAKHDRHSEFQRATFEHLIDACCGILALLSAQFETYDFSPHHSCLALYRPDDAVTGIGDYFLVSFPANWPEDLRYDFDWRELENEANPFQQFDYSKI